MLEACKSEYKRRGSPLEFTRWSPEEVRDYMTVHMTKVKSGGDIGVYARQLPKRKSDHHPAKLPDWVIAELKKRKATEEKSEAGSEDDEENDDEEEDDDGVTDKGWMVMKKKDKYFLKHKDSGNMVDLGDPENDSVWDIKRTRQADCLFQEGNEEYDDIECREVYNQIKSCEQGPEAKKGMKQMVPKKKKEAERPKSKESGKDKEKEEKEKDKKSKTKKIEEAPPRQSQMMMTLALTHPLSSKVLKMNRNRIRRMKRRSPDRFSSQTPKGRCF